MHPQQPHHACIYITAYRASQIPRVFFPILFSLHYYNILEAHNTSSTLISSAHSSLCNLPHPAPFLCYGCWDPSTWSKSLCHFLTCSSLGSTCSHHTTSHFWHTSASWLPFTLDFIFSKKLTKLCWESSWRVLPIFAHSSCVTMITHSSHHLTTCTCNKYCPQYMPFHLAFPCHFDLLASPFDHHYLTLHTPLNL